MRYNSFKWYAFSIPLLATILASEAFGAVLLSTVRSSAVHSLEDGQMKVMGTVPKETLVVGLRTRTWNESYYYVRMLSPMQSPCWIHATDLGEFHRIVTAQNSFVHASSPTAVDSTPLVIREQRDERIRVAWDKIQQAISANETLPEEKRVPEPYFARAEIWTAVHNYPEAMKDYRLCAALCELLGARVAELCPLPSQSPVDDREIYTYSCPSNRRF